LRCVVCNKESEDVLCLLHKRAYENLLQKFEEWKRAMNISWEEYLKEIARNPYTGRWVVEVVEALIRNQGKLLSDTHCKR
jgi:hypothetical protein